MKIYNRTNIPDEVLKLVCVKAGRKVGARTSNAIGKFINTDYACTSGIAYNYAFVRHSWLQRGKPDTYIKTDGGVFMVRIPKRWQERWHHDIAKPDYIDFATELLNTIAHELSHIADYQDCVSYDHRLKRRHHDNRPWERTAIRRAKKATNKSDDFILTLAVALESIAVNSKRTIS